MATTTVLEKPGPPSQQQSTLHVADDSIPAVPPPWHLTGDVYLFSWWASSTLPDHAYSPLEAQSSFAAPTSGQPVGGLAMIQILRYKDSPVGPYDEMLVVPGSFDWPRDVGAGAGAAAARRAGNPNPRISRIYVSQKHSCYNGRLNWNTPKHLARFDWDMGPDDSITVKIYPHDTDDDDGDDTESAASARPFFQASWSPVRFMPSFPFATAWVGRLGLDTTLVMPPLPRGNGSQGELPGTDAWRALVPSQYSRRTRLGWFDIAQRDPDGRLLGPYENFWPGLARWQLGLKMEDADLRFDPPLDLWSHARSMS
ncbi:hypothetical protein NOR_06963 [Metarhizium rileyi]|uniref:Uncharacterized protein n=1 Tax=Metarhizium rileyi (strain RCEF 4871) TaxID=1649241 RepID=A0A166ZG61_METRR|nr:hypothetical protein NOR_06963 [Metarhizium rileyi RCEF 4871]